MTRLASVLACLLAVGDGFLPALLPRSSKFKIRQRSTSPLKMSTEDERLRLESERLSVRAERLRLEAEKASIALEREKLEATVARLKTAMAKGNVSPLAMEAIVADAEKEAAAQAQTSSGEGSSGSDYYEAANYNSVLGVMTRFCLKERGMSAESAKAAIAMFIKNVEETVAESDKMATGPLGALVEPARKQLLEYMLSKVEEEDEDGDGSDIFASAAAAAEASRSRNQGAASGGEASAAEAEDAKKEKVKTLEGYLKELWSAAPQKSAGGMFVLGAFNTFIDGCIKEAGNDATTWEDSDGITGLETIAALLAEAAGGMSTPDLDANQLDEFVEKLDAEALDEDEDTEAVVIPEATLLRLKTEILNDELFAVSQVVKNKQGTAYMLQGKPASDDTDAMMAEVEKRLVATGLDKEIKLFLQQDTSRSIQENAEMDEMDIALALEEEGIGLLTKVRYVCFMAVSCSVQPRPQWGGGIIDVAFNAGSAVATWMFVVGAYTLNGRFSERLLSQDASVLLDAVPLFLMVLGTQAVHDAGHLVAGWFHGLPMQVPRLFPSPVLGLFGSKAKPRAFPKDFASQFDFYVAGPLSGAATAAVLFYAGLTLTAMAPAEAAAAFPKVPTVLLRSSAVISAVTDAVLGTGLSQPTVAATLIGLHPVAIAGLVQLFNSALSLIPYGSSDGANALSAVAGRGSSFFGSLALLWVVWQGWLGGSEILGYFSVVMLLFYSGRPIAVQNELSRTSFAQMAVLAVATAFAVALLSPVNVKEVADMLPEGFGF